MFNNDIRVGNTINPSISSLPVSPNVGQYGWTKTDTGYYNQLIEYVNEAREIVKYVEQVAKYVEEVYNKTQDVERYYNQTKQLHDQTRTMYNDFNGKYTVFNNTISTFNTNYNQFTTLYNEFRESLSEFDKDLEDANQILDQVKVIQGEVDADARDADKSATAAEGYLKQVVDIYDELKEGIVYRGTWNPHTNAWPDNEGTNSTWDVILNTGETEYTWNSIKWYWGDRVIYLKDKNQYTQVESGSTVTSVNSKTGAVILTASDVGAPTKAEMDEASAELPFPDVWIPFSDGLQMLAGYGDEVKVGGYTVAKMASFSRASSATYFDKSGALRTAAVNEPRFEKEGLLIEGQSTNLVPYSQPLVGVSDGWNKGLGATWSNAIGPDGSQCIRVDGLSNVTISNSASALYRGSLGTTDGNTYTISVWVYLESYTGKPEFQLRLSGTNNWTKFITVETGKWVRIQATGLGSSDSNLVIGSGGPTISLVAKIACVQLESLPFASSYIPTNGAAATRAADVVQIPYDNNCISESGTISVEGYGVGSDAWSREFQIGMNSWIIRLPTIASATPTVLGSEILATRDFRQGSNITVGGLPSEVYSAYTWSKDGIKCLLRAEGSIRFTSKAGDTPAIVKNTSGMINISPNTTNSRTGHIRNLRIWHRALTDAQLKSIR